MAAAEEAAEEAAEAEAAENRSALLNGRRAGIRRRRPKRYANGRRSDAYARYRQIGRARTGPPG